MGRVLGGVWRLWEPLRAFLGVIFSCFYLGWSSKGLLEASGLDFGSILGGLEGFWEGLGRVLEGILRCHYECFPGHVIPKVSGTCHPKGFLALSVPLLLRFNDD